MENQILPEALNGNFMATSVGHSKLSMKVFDLNWKRHFPFQIQDSEIQIRCGSFEVCHDFYINNYEKIYQSDEGQVRFFQEEPGAAKNRYYKEAGDFFEFYASGHLVGIFVGTPSDWSTYYIRNISILPDYQNKKISQIFYKKLLMILDDHSVARVEVDISPGNLRHLHIFTKLQFKVTGLKLSERWGALVQLTRFLVPQAEDVFDTQYCSEYRRNLNKAASVKP